MATQGRERTRATQRVQTRATERVQTRAREGMVAGGEGVQAGAVERGERAQQARVPLWCCDNGIVCCDGAIAVIIMVSLQCCYVSGMKGCYPGGSTRGLVVWYRGVTGVVVPVGGYQTAGSSSA